MDSSFDEQRLRVTEFQISGRESPRSRAEGALAVDIVVNNHNYGCFLADAIDSALAQTHPLVKVIVVDDGSTDESRDILEAYDGDVEVVLKVNGGQASALNAGFARSTADVVMFLDADDVLHSHAAALVSSTFAADPRLVKVQFRMALIDEEGRPTGNVKPSSHLPMPGGDVRNAELTFPFDLVWLSTSGNAFSAAALCRILPIPEPDYPLCADWYLVHLTSLLGRVVSLPDVAASCRIHGRNSYALQNAALDLDHVRQTISYAAVTRRALEQLAADLNLQSPYRRILSVSDLANRLVSARLEPHLHPLPRDRAWRLALDGAHAAQRRFDVSWLMKILFVGWFAVAAIAPRSVTRRLAESFLFPERREKLNRLVRRLYRTDWSEPAEPDRNDTTMTASRT
jgi:glycosyltransferase involved in cell wall biosynthesis